MFEILNDLPENDIRRHRPLDGAWHRNLEIHRYLRDAQSIETKTLERWGRTFTAEAFFFHPDPWTTHPHECH